MNPVNCIFLNWNSCCITGQHKTIERKGYLPSSTCMSLQTSTIGSCCCGWQGNQGEYAILLHPENIANFCSLGLLAMNGCSIIGMRPCDLLMTAQLLLLLCRSEAKLLLTWHNNWIQKWLSWYLPSSCWSWAFCAHPFRTANSASPNDQWCCAWNQLVHQEAWKRKERTVHPDGPEASRFTLNSALKRRVSHKSSWCIIIYNSQGPWRLSILSRTRNWSSS